MTHKCTVCNQLAGILVNHKLWKDKKWQDDEEYFCEECFERYWKPLLDMAATEKVI